MPKVQFFTEEISFQLKNKKVIRSWIEKVIKNKGAKLKELNYVFCSDEYLKQVNIEYLDHHYFTDIITFDNSESEEEIEGDIFISIDRIKENSQDYEKPFEEELHRVIIHGVLHLIGFGDKRPEEADEMRQQEETSLSLLQVLQNQ